MGNSQCCQQSLAGQHGMTDDMPIATSVLDGGIFPTLPDVSGGRTAPERTYKVHLKKLPETKIGLDIDYMLERKVLPIFQVAGGVAAQWNQDNPAMAIEKGDAIVEVNGIKGDASKMLESCKNAEELELVMVRALSFEFLVKDLEKLIEIKNCGPLLIRLSWHDAGKFSTGALAGGCPNAVMRLAGSKEALFKANAGLPSVALKLLSPISEKYCPSLISHADLWTLAANVAIRKMGGPEVPTHFGRIDAKSESESVDSQVGRLPDGDKGAEHLREVFNPKGFDDKAIVALSGSHTVGACHLDRSGFHGQWTEDNLKFDNSYFKNLLNKEYASETSSKGCPQFKHADSNTIMLSSDLALVQDPSFRVWVEKYASDEALFFQDFVASWVKLQELGCHHLRDVL